MLEVSSLCNLGTVQEGYVQVSDESPKVFLWTWKIRIYMLTWITLIVWWNSKENNLGEGWWLHFVIFNSSSIVITLNHMMTFIFVKMKEPKFDRVWEEFMERDSVQRDARMSLSQFSNKVVWVIGSCYQ